MIKGILPPTPVQELLHSPTGDTILVAVQVSVALTVGFEPTTSSALYPSFKRNCCVRSVRFLYVNVSMFSVFPQCQQEDVSLFNLVFLEFRARIELAIRLPIFHPEFQIAVIEFMITLFKLLITVYYYFSLSFQRVIPLYEYTEKTTD